MKDFAGCQSRGAREVQEDGYAFLEFGDGHAAGILAVVADGMGAHTAGERASRTALQNFMDAFQVPNGTIAKRLTRALNAANTAIAKETEREPAWEGMGTTLLAASVTREGVEWVSVGDSPLYLFRGGTITRLNADHSLRTVLQEMVENGEIAPTVAEKSKNVLRAALTGDEIALIDRSAASIPLEPGNVILAATDGIHTLSEKEIARVCSESATCHASTVATKLLEMVHNAHNPRQDNTTIAVVKPSL